VFQNFKLISRLLIFDPAIIKQISKKKSATPDGILIIFLGGMASIIGAKNILEEEFYLQIDLNNLIFFSFIFLLGSLFYILFSFAVARLLGGNCKFKNYFRCLAFANVINLLNFSFFLTTFSNIWFILIHYQILKVLNRFSPSQNFLTLVATFLSIVALAVLLS